MYDDTYQNLLIIIERTLFCSIQHTKCTQIVEFTIYVHIQYFGKPLSKAYALLTSYDGIVKDIQFLPSSE